MSDATEQVKKLSAEAEKLKNEGRNDEAVAKCAEVLALDPNHVLTHLTLSVLCFRLKDFERSVQHAEQSCRLAPDDAFNWTALSVTYQRAFAGTGNQQFIRMAEDAMARSHALKGHHH